MCNIGNVYAHLPKTIAQAHNRECIIKVFGICGVYGERCAVTHITAACNLLLCYLAIYAVCRRYNILLEVVWQVELGEDGVHLGIVISLFTKDIHNATRGTLALGLPTYDAHNDLVAIGKSIDTLIDENIHGHIF